MAATRIFIMGVVILLTGIQLRMVETFVLNETATKIVNSRLKEPAEDPEAFTAFTGLSGYGQNTPYASYTTAVAEPAIEKRSVTPPRWLGWSFCSIGAVLILSCPCFRNLGAK